MTGRELHAILGALPEAEKDYTVYDDKDAKQLSSVSVRGKRIVLTHSLRLAQDSSGAFKPFKQHALKVRALWLDPTVGRLGYIGAVLPDGAQVALCSFEKWNMGRVDCLRRNWTVGHTDNIVSYKVFACVKTIYNSYSEEELRREGLLTMKPVNPSDLGL